MLDEINPKVDIYAEFLLILANVKKLINFAMTTA